MYFNDMLYEFDDVDTFDIICYTSVQHATYTLYRLQVKPRLFWYRHHPKMHEMVSDASSQAENWTDL